MVRMIQIDLISCDFLKTYRLKAEEIIHLFEPVIAWPQVRQKQSFRVAAKEFAKGPAVPCRSAVYSVDVP